MKKIVAIVFFLFVKFCFAQFPYFNHYTTKNGLTTNLFYHVWSDSKGYIWLGSENGATRFDGKEFKHFTTKDGLPDNSVIRITEDYLGRVWLITLSGKACYQGKETFKPYAFNDTIKKYLENALLINIYLDKKDNLWFYGQAYPLFYIDKKGNCFKGIEKKLPSERYVFVKEFDDGRLITGTVNKRKNELGLFFQLKTDTAYFTLNQDKYASFAPCVLKTKKNEIILGLNKGLFKYKNNKLTKRETDLPACIISICEDNDGNLWMGLEGFGIWVFPEGNINEPEPQKFLPDLHVMVTKDFENNLWLSTSTKGVFMVPPTYYTFLSEEQGLQSSNVKSACTDANGKIYISTSDGFISEFSDSKLLNQYKPKNSPKGYLYIEKLRLLKNKQIFACVRTESQMYYSILENQVIKKTFPIKGALKTIVQDDKSNKKYITTNAATWEFTGDTGIIVTGNKPFRSYAVAKDQDNKIWIGNPAGLFKIENGHPVAESDSKIQALSQNILSIFSLENNWLLFTTNGNGIYLYNTKTKAIQNIYSDKNCFCDFPSHAVRDGDNFWFACEKGFIKVKFYLYNPPKYDITNFSSLKGVSDAGIQDLNLYGNTVLASTTKGLFSINIKKLKKETNYPPVYITSAFANESILNFNAENILDYDDYKIRFSFHGISYIDPDLITFKYMLSGHDTSWSFTKIPMIQYNSLTPGKYTFKVYAVYANSKFSKQPATVFFTILTPFWKTWWFSSLVVIFVVIVIYSYIKIREKQLIKEKIFLEKTVRERTKEIESQKEEILGINEELKSQKQVLETYNVELEKLSIVARETDNAVIIMDKEGNIEWMNEGCTRMYGFTLDEIIEKRGKNILFSSNYKNIQEAFDVCVNKSHSISYESETITKDGTKLWIQTTLTPYFKTNGELQKLIAIDADITKLKAATEEIRIKNITITENIEYAKFIQDAILPSENRFKNSFSDYFIFYKPKDIVSGDFYWCKNFDDTIYLAVVDCTGHGVSGAFMSMIGNTLLNEIITPEKQPLPSQALTELNNKTISALKQSGDFFDSGMDLTLLKYDKNKGILSIALANHKVFFYDGNILRKIEGSIYSIGGIFSSKKDIMFDNITLQVKENNKIFLFSDGFIDQFGAENLLKFGSERFEKLIVNTLTLKGSCVNEYLENELNKWEKHQKQIDDILVIGITF